MKKYVWGFPGIGKSNVTSKLSIVDADYNSFKFIGVDNSKLHGQSVEVKLNPDFPQNYFEFIGSVDADIVFVNCHLSLLPSLDDVLVIYPDKSLKEEYLQRYSNRGDNNSFVSYMETEFDTLVDFIDSLDVSKIKVFDNDVFMQNIIESEEFKVKVMTRSEIAKQLQRAIHLNVMAISEIDNSLIFNIEYARDYYGVTPNYIKQNYSVSDLTEGVLNGTHSLDIDELEKVCREREAELKKEREILISRFQKAIDLGVLDVDINNNTVVCSLSFVNNKVASAEKHDAYDLADDIINGKYKVDVEHLLVICKQREEQLVELKYAEKRGGLSRAALEDKIMQGIVNGALGIEYGEIAPYSHGYKVAFGSDRDLGSTYGAKVSWNCYCSLFDVPKTIVDSIEKGTKSLDISEIIEAIDDTERDVITSFVPEKETDFKRRDGYTRGSIASVMDVHAGKGLDGIVKHHYHGDYSSYTPCAQNSLVEALVCLKGFCLDCINTLDVGAGERNKIIDYLKKQGTDISTPEKLNEWIKANPDKCGLEENRVDKDEYYVVQCDVHTKDEPYYKSAYEANSFDNFDDAMALAHELCDDIVGLAKEHEKNGDVLDDICVLRVVENEAALRVKEEVVFIQEYNEQEHQISNVDAVLSDAKDRAVEGTPGKGDIDKEF